MEGGNNLMKHPKEKRDEASTQYKNRARGDTSREHNKTLFHIVAINQYESEFVMIPRRSSAPSSPGTSPIPGARSSTLRWGKVPCTIASTSFSVYPTAFSPRGTSRPSKNAAIAS